MYPKDHENVKHYHRICKSLLFLFFALKASLNAHGYSLNNDHEALTPNSMAERQVNVIAKSRQKAGTLISSPNQFPVFSETGKTHLYKVPQRPLQPPFPNGLCGGRLVILGSEEHYEVQSNNEFLNESGFVLPPRNIAVWLPPDYDIYENMDFPVLYCHDGQNAMEDSSSWTGYSWRLAGALTRLAERKMLQRTTSTLSPPIVVMMPCAEERIAFVPRRHLEYGDISQPFAQAHADFVGLILKPLIDSKFRTLPGKEHNSVIGSSLGGQASLHLLLRHPELFGNVACLSPAFQPSILSSMTMSNSEIWKNKRIYIDNGGDVDEIKVPFLDFHDHLSKDHWWNPGYWWLDSQLQPGIDAMKVILDAKGINYKYYRFAGGRHNERAWASRIDKPLLSLYGDVRTNI